MTRYFAYGSNMDPKQMGSRCPGAVPLGRARLRNYELTFVGDSPRRGGGVATVIPSSSREVWGVLWDLTDDHIATLDVYEGIDAGAYVKADADVEAESDLVNALIYLATDDRYKQPSQRYLDVLLAGATAFELPADYVEQLRAARAR